MVSLDFECNPPGGLRKGKLPLLSPIPRSKDLRNAIRMPLYCARDLIYATALEMRNLERKVYCSPHHKATPFFEGHAELAALHDDLFQCILKSVIHRETGVDGKMEKHLVEELHKFESLYYFTVVHVCMLYHELYEVFSAGRFGSHELFADEVTAETAIDHLLYHWSTMVNADLMATLDFAVRKERLFEVKIKHNIAVFTRSRTYSKNRDLTSLETSIRNALNAVPFNELQLDVASNIQGLRKELIEMVDIPALVLLLVERHRPPSSSFSGSVLSLPQIWIPEENLPPPLDLERACFDFDSYVEQDDPFSEAAAPRPCAPPSCRGRRQTRPTKSGTPHTQHSDSPSPPRPGYTACIAHSSLTSSPPLITHPEVTRAQHEHDSALNANLMQHEREKALRMLCGEETTQDVEEDRESVASETIRFWRVAFG